MNTPVNFELAKMLKEVGFDLPVCNVFETSMLHGRESYFFEKEYELDNHNKKDGENTNYYSRPTIADVVMWLYEKYGIWITVTSISQESWQCHMTKKGDSLGKCYLEDFYTPTEAYEAALIHVLEILNAK